MTHLIHEYHRFREPLSEHFIKDWLFNISSEENNWNKMLYNVVECTRIYCKMCQLVQFVIAIISCQKHTFLPYINGGILYFIFVIRCTRYVKKLFDIHICNHYITQVSREDRDGLADRGRKKSSPALDPYTHTLVSVDTRADYIIRCI